MLLGGGSLENRGSMGGIHRYPHGDPQGRGPVRGRGGKMTPAKPGYPPKVSQNESTKSHGRQTITGQNVTKQPRTRELGAPYAELGAVRGDRGKMYAKVGGCTFIGGIRVWENSWCGTLIQR
jgi:hypothetical protein